MEGYIMKLLKQIFIGLAIALMFQGPAFSVKKKEINNNKQKTLTNDNETLKLKNTLIQLTLDKLYNTLFCLMQVSGLDELETGTSICSRNNTQGPDDLGFKYVPYYILCKRINKILDQKAIILRKKGTIKLGDLLITLSKGLLTAITMVDHISSPLCLDKKEQLLIKKFYEDKQNKIDSFQEIKNLPIEATHEIFKTLNQALEKFLKTPLELFKGSGKAPFANKRAVFKIINDYCKNIDIVSFDSTYTKFVGEEAFLKNVLLDTKSKIYKTIFIAMRTLFYNKKIGKILKENGLNEDLQQVFIPSLKNKNVAIRVARNQLPYYILCESLNKLEDALKNFDTLKKSPKHILYVAAKTLSVAATILYNITPITDEALKTMQTYAQNKTLWNNLLEQNGPTDTEKAYLFFTKIINKFINAPRTLFKDNSDIVKALIFAFFNSINKNELFKEYEIFNKTV